MPNGYTADIYDGKSVTLREFILKGGRAFGFALAQRDQNPLEPADLTPEIADTSHFDKQIAEARKKLADLASLEDLPIASAAKRDHHKALKAWQETNERSRQLSQRYTDMMKKLAAWQVPDELLEMKNTMLRWLQESLEHDCYTYDKPTKQEPGDWLAAQIERAVRDLNYWTKERGRVLYAVDERNRIRALLVECLPEDVP